MKTKYIDNQAIKYVMTTGDGGVDGCFTKMDADSALTHIESYKDNESTVSHNLNSKKELIVQGGTLTLSQNIVSKGTIKVLSGATLYLKANMYVGFSSGTNEDREATNLLEVYDGATLVLDGGSLYAYTASNIIIHKYAIVIFKNVSSKIILSSATTNFEGKYKDLNGKFSTNWTDTTYITVNSGIESPTISIRDFNKIVLMNGTSIKFSDLLYSGTTISDSAILSVASDGTVTALEEGVATITIAISEITFTINVTVFASMTSVKQEYFNNQNSDVQYQFIKMSDSETTISDQIFPRGSGYLQELITSKNLTTISDMGLYGLYTLKKLYLYDKFSSTGNQSIGSLGTSTTYGAQVVCYATTPPTLGENAFYSSKIYAVYVPDSAIAAYQAAAGWSTYTIKSISLKDETPVATDSPL